MKRVLLSLGLCVLCLVVASNLVFAGTHDQARFALHAKPNFVPTKTITTLCEYSPTNDTTAVAVPCSQYTVNQATNVYRGPHVFLVVGQLGSAGILGASAGIMYDGSAGVGVDPKFVQFTACTDGQFYPSDPPAQFPKPGGGFRITWFTCQNRAIPPNGVHAVVGAFYTYAYSPDVLRVTPNNTLQSGPELAVTSCSGGTTDLLQVYGPYPGALNGALGKIGYGNSAGYTPCGVVPTAETTWGKLKTLYNDK